MTVTHKHIKQEVTFNITDTSYQTSEVALAIPAGYALTGISGINTLDGTGVDAYIVSMEENGTKITLGYVPERIGEFRVEIFLSCQRLTK